MRIPLPESLHLRMDLIENPVPTRAAATIAVVRDSEHGLEAFLMRRNSALAFAPGMYVFPGGSVHPSDSDEITWVGPPPEQWAQRFNCDADLAKALVVSAIRETFEETGVLLAGPDEHSVLDDTTGLDDFRDALENEELSFAEFLAQHDLVLRADLIGAWAHWITPVFEPKRFDTRFFVAALPAGQRIDSVNQEADKAIWAPLSTVLDEISAGRVSMLPPTLVTCQELSVLTTDSLLSASEQRTIVPIEPKIEKVDGQLWLVSDRGEHL